MSNKRKLENATFEQKMSVIQHDLFSFSAFCTELHRVTNYHLDVCKLEKLLVSLILWLENNMIKKNLLAFAMLAQKLFLLFTAVVSEKITGSNISCLNQNELFQNSSSEKLATRFCLLGMYFHFNLCKKEDCSACKF